MKVIWKQILEITNKQEISVPKYSKFLGVQNQNDDSVVWYICDPDSLKETVTILCYGTGHKIEVSPSQYIGTTQELGGKLVWHWFLE